MTDQAELIERWEPLPALPEHPFDSLDLTLVGQELVVTAYYGFDPPAPALQINFGEPEAFKAYDEFSDPWMETKLGQPMANNSNLNPWVWPLQEVRNSLWLKRVVARNSPIIDFPWRHFVVVTGTVTLHVMTDGKPVAALVS